MSTNVFTDEMSDELLHHVPGLDFSAYSPSQAGLVLERAAVCFEDAGKRGTSAWRMLSEIQALLQRTGRRMVGASASDWASLGDPHALARLEADPERVGALHRARGDGLRPTRSRGRRDTHPVRRDPLSRIAPSGRPVAGIRTGRPASRGASTRRGGSRFVSRRPFSLAR